MAENKTVVTLLPRKTVLQGEQKVGEFIRLTARPSGNAMCCEIVDMEILGDQNAPCLLDVSALASKIVPQGMHLILRFNECHLGQGLTVVGFAPNDPTGRVSVVFRDCTGSVLSLQKRIAWIDLQGCHMGELRATFEESPEALLFSKCAFVDRVLLEGPITQNGNFSLDFRTRLFNCRLDPKSVTPNIAIPRADVIVTNDASWAGYFWLACPGTSVRFEGVISDLM